MPRCVSNNHQSGNVAAVVWRSGREGRAGGNLFNPTATKPNTSLANTWTWYSIGVSNYNSLQVDLNHRFNDGFLLRGVYTWSKALDDGDSLNATAANNAVAVLSNPYNPRADYGLATYDVRNDASIDFSYELPIGRNKRFMNGMSGFANGVISGWSVNSIVTLQGGFPFTPQLSYNPANNGDTRNPVQPFLNPAFTGPVVTGNVNQWFNPNAFIAPPSNSGFYGNLGRDTYIGPGLATWDLSVSKDTRIREGMSLQFRAELFNLLNRANFNTPNLITDVLEAPPNTTVPEQSPTAGQIISTSTTSRQIQFGLKLLWRINQVGSINVRFPTRPRFRLAFLLAALIVASTIAPRATSQKKTDITVSAAVSLKDALDAAAQLYKSKNPGAAVHFNLGGSGTLQRQIEQGAPADLFISASPEEMDKLESENLLLPGSRRNLVTNRVVLIVPSAATTTVASFQDLTKPEVKLIAIGEPRTVPAGMYAEQILTHLGLYDRLKPKFVFGKDVRGVLTYVATGNADAGIVYATDARISPKVKVVADAPPGSHSPVIYPIAVVRASRNAAAAKDLQTFLLSAPARAVFAKYGFGAPAP